MIMTYTIEHLKAKKEGIMIQINQQIFYCDEYIYKVLLPYEGKHLDFDQYQLLIAFANAHQVLKPLFKKIFNQQISKNELKSILEKEEISISNITLIIDQLMDDGYLDDKNFITYHQPLFEENKGKKAFKDFLMMHRISSILIEEALATYQENEDFVKEYIEKLKNSNHSSNKILKYKIMQKLYVRGFSEQTIQKVLKEICFDSDLENLKHDYQQILAKNEKNKYKIISKLINKGYNVEDVLKIVGNGEKYE